MVTISKMAFVIAFAALAHACLSDAGTRGSADGAGESTADSAAEIDASSGFDAANAIDTGTEIDPDSKTDASDSDEHIEADTAAPDELDVSVDGLGQDGAGEVCPIARIVVREGGRVAPQTVLHLSGLGSSSPHGPIQSYEWFVSAPLGSVATFSPSLYVAEPTFEVNVAGVYFFRLMVHDALGTASCRAAEAQVLVVPGDGIHVELLWDTPGDMNQADTGGDQIYFSVGSDVDLHFLHPKAYGQYFDWTYDCYWDNVNPEWGIFAPEDNPRLDRDDTDGAGPENLSLVAPESDAVYRVGVHYWNDWAFGPSQATVRIYIDGELREEWGGVHLENFDLWESHEIAWPGGEVTRIGDAPQITPYYRDP